MSEIGKTLIAMVSILVTIFILVAFIYYHKPKKIKRDNIESVEGHDNNPDDNNETSNAYYLYYGPTGIWK